MTPWRPKVKVSSSTWQVKVGEGIPCVVTPLKPKYYLLGQLKLDPSTAVKLKWVWEDRTGASAWQLLLDGGHASYCITILKMVPLKFKCLWFPMVITKPQHFWYFLMPPSTAVGALMFWLNNLKADYKISVSGEFRVFGLEEWFNSRWL